MKIEYKKLNQLLQTYVTRFRLEDWNIEIIKASKKKSISIGKRVNTVINSDIYGEAISYPDTKEAIIIIYPNAHRSLKEFEDTIKHELLHILLSPITEYSSRYFSINLPKKAPTFYRQLHDKEHQIISNLLQFNLRK